MNNDFFSELRQIFNAESGASSQPDFSNPHLNAALRGTEAGTSPPTQSEDLTRCFAPDFHPQFGESLCAFPRAVNVELPACNDFGYEITFWPDLNTFSEGAGERHLMYYPPSRSKWSLQITYSELHESYAIALFCEFECDKEEYGDDLTQLLSCFAG